MGNQLMTTARVARGRWGQIDATARVVLEANKCQQPNSIYISIPLSISLSKGLRINRSHYSSTPLAMDRSHYATPLSTSRSIALSIGLAIDRSHYLSISLHNDPYVYLPISLSISLSISLTTNRSHNLSISRPVHPTIYLSHCRYHFRSVGICVYIYMYILMSLPIDISTRRPHYLPIGLTIDTAIDAILGLTIYRYHYT